MLQISLDSNRLMKPTQRRFNATWLEFSGDALNVLPQVARELTNGKFIGDLDSSLDYAAEALRIARQREDEPIAFIAACDLWWLDEFIRQDSPYRLVTLSREENIQATELRRSLPSEAFPRIGKEDIVTDSDAIIISQALVKSQNLLITSDSRSLRHDVINEWIQAQGNERGIRSQAMLFVQDEIMPALFAGKEEDLLYIALAASWPGDPALSNQEVAASFDRQLRAMLTGALLPNTAELIRSQWRGMTTSRETILSYVRENYLPEKTRLSEARHPGSPSRRDV